MYFQLQPFSRLMSRIFSVSSARVIPGSPYAWSMIFSENRFPLFGIMLCSRHLLGSIAHAALRCCARDRLPMIPQARPHHRHVARIELLAHLGEEGAAAAHQEIDDVVAHRIIERVTVDVIAHALL